MTRKDYILLAAALKDARGHRFDMPREGLDTAARYLAGALSADNPRGFDRELFLKNAGVQS